MDLNKDCCTHSYPIIDLLDKLKLTGRFDEVREAEISGITMDNACNCIGFTAECEGDVTIDLNVRLSLKTVVGSSNLYFTVYVDGIKQEGRPYITGVPSESTDCVLVAAKGLRKGIHTIEIYRQNEPLKGSMIAKSINLKGKLLDRPADKPLYIEFVGDSITAGYGNMGLRGIENPSHADNSDATRTYAFLTAEALGADISVLCRSGMGFSLKTILFTDYYTNTCYMTRPGKVYKVGRHPDIVVVNLGTNDRVKSDIAIITEYTQKAIETIRGAHPNCKIVWAYGLMGRQLEPQITAGLNNCGGEENGIYYCPLVTDYSGGGGHTSADGHKAGAADLTKFINERVLNL